MNKDLGIRKIEPGLHARGGGALRPLFLCGLLLFLLWRLHHLHQDSYSRSPAENGEPARLQESSRSGALEAFEVRGEQGSFPEGSRFWLASDAVEVVRGARAFIGLRDPLGTLNALQALLAPFSPIAGQAPGPIVEEALLLRALARLELSASQAEAADDAASLAHLAEKDLQFLVKNLTPASDVCQAALYLQALWLEKGALERVAFRRPLSRGPSGDPVAALESAIASLEKVRSCDDLEVPVWVVVSDRLTRILERLGRLDAARTLVQSIESLDPQSIKSSGRLSPLHELLGLGPNSALRIHSEAPFRKADLAYFSGDLCGALHGYERAILQSKSPELLPWGHLQKASVFRLLGDGRGSFEALGSARSALSGLQPRPGLGPLAARSLSSWKSRLHKRIEALDF